MEGTRNCSDGEIFRFFADGCAPTTVRKALKANLELPRQPFEYNSFSPTPLDPYRLKITNGLFYDESARIFMERMQQGSMPRFDGSDHIGDIERWAQDRVGELSSVRHTTWESVMREISVQHNLKQRRNDTALGELHGRGKRLISPQEAEEIMQVRAGIAPLATMFRFMARYPEIGGLEIMKATRPFNPMGIRLARVALMHGLGSLDEQDADIELATGIAHRIKIKPEKDIQEIPDPRIVVLKTRLAQVAVELDGRVSFLDVIWRDSCAMLDPDHDDRAGASILRDTTDGSVFSYAVPIAATAYVRLAQD